MQDFPVMPDAPSPAESCDTGFSSGAVQPVGMTLPELETFVQELGQPKFRAKQLFGWLHRQGAQNWEEMTNLPAPLRQKLAEVATAAVAKEVTRQADSRTGTIKFLFELAGGGKVETVLMRHQYGNSVCVTTQVGCQMGCTFCASTIGGLLRNLTAGEMVGQVILAGLALPEGERVSSVVFMGSGEPLENYDNVLKAIRLINHPEGLGIGYRHITLSTCGLVPEIKRLTGEGLPITLALSLHAPTTELRSQLMPVNRTYPLPEVIKACKAYADTTGRRVTYEYILIAGVNDQDAQADQLAALLRGSLAHVNLIPMNPVQERPFKRPSKERVERFRSLLEAAGLTATVRREMGGQIDAACGQLRSRDRLKGRGEPRADQHQRQK